MVIARSFVIGLIFLSTVGARSVIAAPDEYDDSQSNPFRVAAYLLHPVGVVTEWVLFRPLHFLVSANEPLEKFFGHRPHPPILAEPEPYHYYGATRKVPLKEPAARPMASAPAPAAPVETVKVVEVPVVKTVVKEVPKVVEVEKVIFPAVAFRFDSAELTDLGRGQVYLAAQRLKEETDVTVVIEGHADAVGSEDYNQKLGARRAQTVIDALVSHGIDRSRIAAAAIGERAPLIDQDTEWARAVNRRVEFEAKGASR